MSTSKLLPENIQIPTPGQKAGATGLLGFSNTLPECPARLPDGTILDYSAVDETWKDVDFPERGATVAESRASLEESFFRSFQESNQSQKTPAHILKHMTRVQSLAALVPTKTEAAAPAPEVEVVRFAKLEDKLSEMVAAVNAILESNNLVIEAANLDSYVEGIAEVLEQHELPEEDRVRLQELFGPLGDIAGGIAKGVGAVASGVSSAAKKVGSAVSSSDTEDEEEKGSAKRGKMKKWQSKKDADEMGERSPEARAKKAMRREAELGMKLSQNKAAAAKSARPSALALPSVGSSSAEKKTWSKKGPAAPVHKQPGYFTWRAKQKAQAAT